MARIIEAELTSISVKDGGSRHSIYSGYRGVLHFDDDSEELTYGVEVRPSVEEIRPGESTVCEVRFLVTDPPALSGARFVIRDGRMDRVSGVVLRPI